jgi:hypothetical protein
LASLKEPFRIGCFLLGRVCIKSLRTQYNSVLLLDELPACGGPLELDLAYSNWQENVDLPHLFQ